MVSRETQLLSFNYFFNRHAALFTSFRGGAYSFDSLSALLLWLGFLNREKPLLLAFPDQHTSERVYHSAYHFLPGTVCFFPGGPDQSTSVPGFISENQRYRQETIRSLNSFDGILFATEESKDELSVPVVQDETCYVLAKNAAVDPYVLIDSLVEWGYERVEKTVSPDTFSVRGGIVDIFLNDSRHPVRVEFFGSTIESIRAFNPVSQRRISDIDSVDVRPPSSFYKEKTKHISVVGALPENSVSFTCLFVNGLWTVYADNCPLETPPVLIESEKTNDITGMFSRSEYNPKASFVFIENESQIQQVLGRFDFQPFFLVGALPESCILGDVALLSGNDLLKKTPLSSSRWETDFGVQKPLSSLLSLSDGDYLVHRDYGIGRYQGLSVLESKAGLQECIKIIYNDGAAVHVPLDKFDRVHRYIGKEKEKVVLSTLGSPRWKNEKKKVVDAAADVVRSLVLLYKARNSTRGFLYGKDDVVYQSVVDTFPYEETDDQSKSISNVITDMETDRPMDRLVCGDVGFGKTEVALRAATKAVMSGKKVLVLSPTTILADQHYITFKNRLDPVGIKTELLSRFRTKTQQNKILEKMMTQELDIVIGTHRLLSSDVQFPNLGLIIIDEEHRFGVKHKERLRELKASLDVLTLTATPIPRTLQQSLIGIRDLSTINTPPKTRKPIHTSVNYFHWEIVEKVIRAELLRNGQVYFLHNDIQALPFYYKELYRKFPDASIAIAHGQMSSRELEKTILAFFSGEIDVLLCTTIIESGLDVTNANTIIINQAQNFGLSQLYQIRGRVGRGHRQAYCCLMVPKQKKLSSDAYQRLKALEYYTSLGSGYNIALRDLEIRGAGNLFGTKQSGHMAKVGFELYCKLLEEAAEEQTGTNKELKTVPSVTLFTKTLLEEDYVPLVQDRLYFYQQLSSCSDMTSLDDIHDELRDRFGSLPRAAKMLLKTTVLRVRLTGSSVSSLVISKNGTTLVLKDVSPFSSFTEMTDAFDNTFLPQGQPYRFQQTGSNMIRVFLSARSFIKAFSVSEEFVKLFSVLENK